MKHLVALVAGAQGEELTVDFECGKASAMRAHVVFETAEAKACEVGRPLAHHLSLMACELFQNLSGTFHSYVRTTVWQEEILGLNKVPTWCSPELLE